MAACLPFFLVPARAPGAGAHASRTDTLEAVYRGGLRWWHEDWWRGRDTVRCIERDIDIPLATQCSYH